MQALRLESFDELMIIKAILIKSLLRYSMTYTSKVHIPAGQFSVETQYCLVFQACLGICLGVALYDRVKKAGGLIHILLPEPATASCDPQPPEKYAVTDLLMLINTLLQMGCTPENMTATIAGGIDKRPLEVLNQTQIHETADAR